MRENPSLEKIDKGVYEIKFSLGDRRKATSSLWAKVVTDVDESKKGGYAFDGSFIRSGDIVHEGDLILMVVGTGSWKYPGQDIHLYKIEHGKCKELYRGGWETKGDKLRAILSIKKLVKKAKLKYKTPKIIKKGRIKQIKQTERGIKQDRKKKALPPGVRRSKSGKVYREYRSNRSDEDMKRRL